MADPTLSLIVPTADAGLELALHVSRLSIKAMQPDAAVRDGLRVHYAHDAAELIACSQVVATNFATVAAANNYWR